MSGCQKHVGHVWYAGPCRSCFWEKNFHFIIFFYSKETSIKKYSPSSETGKVYFFMCCIQTVYDQTKNYVFRIHFIYRLHKYSINFKPIQVAISIFLKENYRLFNSILFLKHLDDESKTQIIVLAVSVMVSLGFVMITGIVVYKKCIRYGGLVFYSLFEMLYMLIDN